MAAPWSSNDLFVKMRKGAEALGRDAIDVNLRFHIDTWIDSPGMCESPLEAAFSIWWRVYDQYLGLSALMLVPQHEVDLWVSGQKKRYRLDFMLKPMEMLFETVGEPLGAVLKFAIELDGHEFHERTKEQVTLRNQRDRDLQASGWTVYHVSGSEFVNQPEKTLASIYDAATNALIDVRVQIAKHLTGKTPNRVI